MLTIRPDAMLIARCMEFIRPMAVSARRRRGNSCQKQHKRNASIHSRRTSAYVTAIVLSISRNIRKKNARSGDVTKKSTLVPTSKAVNQSNFADGNGHQCRHAARTKSERDIKHPFCQSKRSTTVDRTLVQSLKCGKLTIKERSITSITVDKKGQAMVWLA